MLCSKPFCSAFPLPGVAWTIACMALLCQGCSSARVVRNIGYGGGPEPEKRSSMDAAGFGLSPLSGLSACPRYSFSDRDGRELRVVPDAFLPVDRNLVLTMMLADGGSDLSSGDVPEPAETSGTGLALGFDRLGLWEAEPSLLNLQLLATAAVESGDHHQIVHLASAEESTSRIAWLVSMKRSEKKLAIYSIHREEGALAASVQPEHAVVTEGTPLHAIAIGDDQIRVIEQKDHQIVVGRYTRSSDPASDGDAQSAPLRDQTWTSASVTPIASLRNPGERVVEVLASGDDFLMLSETSGTEKAAAFWGNLDGSQGRTVYEGTVLAMAASQESGGFSSLYLSLPRSARQAFHPVFGKMAVGGVWRLKAGLDEEMVWERISRIPFQWLNPLAEGGVWATVDQSSLVNDFSEMALRTFAFADEPAGDEKEVAGACSAFSARQIEFFEGQGLVGLGSWGQMARLACADSL